MTVCACVCKSVCKAGSRRFSKHCLETVLVWFKSSAFFHLRCWTRPVTAAFVSHLHRHTTLPQSSGSVPPSAAGGLTPWESVMTVLKACFLF